ncbi:MAG TPA: hypothetical protein VJ276_21320 [Thermoanaerobaculia bacterium]|nr:hypothetical protein [Thermoanaerobaculia bacterium]
MILDLGGHGLDVGALLRREKRGVSARGPLVQARGTPLAELREGDKLHIVGIAGEARLDGKTPAELVALLAALGLPRGVRLKQVHLIADETGRGGGESYAARLSAALIDEGFDVDEIKAPRGRVRWDEEGKVHILDGEQWVPSERGLNAYVGPRVADKHR